LVAIVKVLSVVRNGGLEVKDSLIPLNEFSFIDLDFVFKLSLEFSSGNTSSNFVILSVLNLFVQGVFEITKDL